MLLPRRDWVTTARLLGESWNFLCGASIGAVARAEYPSKVTTLPVGDRWRSGESGLGLRSMLTREIEGCIICCLTCWIRAGDMRLGESERSGDILSLPDNLGLA